MEIEFITLGDASERLGVPASTLRNWTDQLEEYNVHFVKRNNRNERVYYDSDLEIFSFLNKYKEEHGRKTSTKDLAYMIGDMGDKFRLRTKDNAPSPIPSNKTRDVLNQEDIKKLMANPLVVQFMEVVISETAENLREELVEKIKEEMRAEHQENRQIIEASRKEQEAQLTRIEEEQKDHRDINLESLEMIKELTKQLNEKQESEKKEAKKGFFQKMFG